MASQQLNSATQHFICHQFKVLDDKWDILDYKQVVSDSFFFLILALSLTGMSCIGVIV